MKKSKISIAAIVLAAALSLGALSGCSDNTPKAPDTPSGTPTETGEAKPPAENPSKDSIVIATENETPSLTAEKHNAVAGDYMNRLTYNGLMKPGIDLEPELDLAESIEIDAEDHTKWNVKLKEGVKFHNGAELKAEDVKASLDQARTAPDVALYTTNIIEVEVVSDYELILHTAEPSAVVLTDLSHHGNYIYPKALIDEKHDFNKDPIGTGPYKLTNWVSGDRLEFVAFDEYFDQENAPKIKNMTWQIIPEGTSRTIALETGDADFVVELATSDIPKLQDNPDIEVLIIPGTSYNWMMINNEKEPFNNADFRKALDYAINKQDVVDAALDGLAVPAYHASPTGFQGNSDENLNEYNLEKAKEHLAASGIDPATASFKVICSNDQKTRCAEVIQANLQELGIKMEIERMDLATYLEVTSVGDYEASIGGYTSNTLLAYMLGVFHSESIGGSNKTRTNNAEIDALLDKAKTTVDDEERFGYMEQANSILNSLTPQIALYQDTVKRAYNAKLGGVEVSAAGTLYFNNVYWTE